MKVNIEFKRDLEKSKRYHLSFSSWISARSFLDDFFKADENNEVLNIRMWVSEGS